VHVNVTSPTPPLFSPLPRAERKKACQRCVQSSGTQLRLTWGNTQEAAAVYTLLCLFPASQLQEVRTSCSSLTP
jgi:hypothetical protein